MMAKKSNMNYIGLTVGSILSLFVFGLFDNLKGSTISALLGEMNFSYSLGGVIVMGQYTGYFAATFLAGRMLDCLGHKITFIFAGICMLAGVAGYAVSSVIPLLLFFIFLIGMGLGTFELSGSNVITVYYPEKKGRYLTYGNGCYFRFPKRRFRQNPGILFCMRGLGGMFGPWIMGIASDCCKIDWGIALGSIFLAGIAVLCSRIPD